MPYKNKEKQKKYQQEHYKKNKEFFVDRNKTRRIERKAWFRGVTKDIECSICKEKERCCLSFHHLNPKEKDQAVSVMLNDFRSKERVLAEMKKCIVLCENCHRKVHAGIIILARNGL